MREQVSALRREMKKRGIFAYIVMTEDFHGSEYVGEHFKLREYLSGFTGSAGVLVVTERRPRSGRTGGTSYRRRRSFRGAVSR